MITRKVITRKDANGDNRYGWRCARCKRRAKRGDWRREGDNGVFYCQPCVDALGGPPYDPSIPPLPSAVRAARVNYRRARRYVRLHRRN
jgi:ribosomal protein L37AE/L43A